MRHVNHNIRNAYPKRSGKSNICAIVQYSSRSVYSSISGSYKSKIPQKKDPKVVGTNFNCILVAASPIEIHAKDFMLLQKPAAQFTSSVNSLNQ
jgi:hypothetical protein